jgi:glucuronate isomerase
MNSSSKLLHPHRYFSPDPAQREMAYQLYQHVAHLPLVCPHGHVDPRLFSDPNYRFGSPTELFLIPDHYIFRMLYSQGVPLESLAVPRRDGGATETDHRKAWQLFAEHYYLFRGTPTGLWLREELTQLFGIEEVLNGRNAQHLYDNINAQLHSLPFQPRHLYDGCGDGYAGPSSDDTGVGLERPYPAHLPPRCTRQPGQRKLA